MDAKKLVSDLIAERKTTEPIELNFDQALLLEIARNTHVIRKGVGILAFLAWVGVIGGILTIIF